MSSSKKYLKNHLCMLFIFVKRCVLLIVFFSLSCADDTVSQDVGHCRKLTRIVALEDFSNLKATKGEQIFSDRNYVFKKLPSIFEDVRFLQVPFDSEMQIKPLTSGCLFVITPLRGNQSSQEDSLLKMGFSPINYPSLKLFEEQSGELGIFRKYIHDKFDVIRLTSWAIPFFSSAPVSSISVGADVILSPDGKYSKQTRKWQGCPSIERTNGKLWATWFSGGNKEPDKGNYGVVSFSNDDGNTWIDPVMIVIHPDTSVRVMDTQFWKDPVGRLWLFWTQNTGAYNQDGLWGTWAIRTDNPDSDIPVWTKPRRLCDGLMRNKVTVLSTGEWLLPSYNWINMQSAVYVSDDEGETWTLKGGPYNESTNYYEHMVVELNDGKLWMLQRNIKESYSSNKGKDWTPLENISSMTSANARLYLGRLKSGNLLLVYNNDPEKKTRKNLTAFLSMDDGKTWPFKLLIDERQNVSYPDIAQDESGLIYLSYDRSRNGDKEILLSIFSEKDIVAGKFESTGSCERKIISKVD